MKKNVLLILFIVASGVFAHAQELIPQQDEKGKYGFVDASGTFIIKPQFDDIFFEFTNGIACVQSKKKFFFINEKGDRMTKSSYNWVGHFDENNLCLVNNGGKLNENGEIEGGKFGYIDYSGKEIVPVKYNAVSRFNEHGIASINQGGSVDKEGNFDGGKYGFVNLLGKELISPKYTRVGDFDKDGIAWVNIGGKENAKTGEFTGGKFGYINNRGVEIITPKYTFVGPFIDGICWINTGGKTYLPNKDKIYGLKIKGLQKTKMEITKAIRDSIADLQVGGKRDVRRVPVKGGKFGFLDIHGREITKIKYTQTANTFTEDRAWVQLGKKYGFIDKSGKEITKIIYDGVSPEYHNQMASVLSKGKYGLINSSGQEVTKIEFLNIGEFESGFAWVKQFPEKVTKKKTSSVKYAFINENGQLITPYKYDMVHPEISEGRIGVFYDGYWGYINEKGEEITSNRFIDNMPFQDGVAWVKIKDAEIAQSNDLKEKISVQPLSTAEQKTIDDITLIETLHIRMNKYSSINETKSNSIKMHQRSFITQYSLKHTGKYGLIDKDGNVITEFKYTRVTPFSEDLSLVHMANAETGKMVSGYINRQGEAVIPFIYSTALPFKDGVAPVLNMDEKWGFINKKGEEFIPCQYSDVSKEFKSDIAGVKINEKWGGVNKENVLVIPALLDSPEDIFNINERIYLVNDKAPITERQVKLYTIYKDDKRNNFSIKTTIPDQMWDY